jgi:hypothetical protein
MPKSNSTGTHRFKRPWTSSVLVACIIKYISSHPSVLVVNTTTPTHVCEIHGWDHGDTLHKRAFATQRNLLAKERWFE